MFSRSQTLGSSSTDSGFNQQTTFNSSNRKQSILKILVLNNPGDNFVVLIVLFGLLGYLFRSFNGLNPMKSKKSSVNVLGKKN